MPVPVAAPYDPLSKVTEQVRTILADYIQGINPSPQGTVNTNGTAVTWVSGPTFSIYFNGAPININGTTYQVLAVTSATTLNLTVSAGVQAAVSYVATLATGDIFADSQAYVLPTINLAYRKFQKKLDYASHPRMRNEVDILNLPVAGSSDPATQQWINWTNFYDGANLTSTPTLPQDFLSPLRLYERQSTPAGVLNNTRFREMTQATDGLPSVTKSSRNFYWDWREDAIYLIGSIVNLDLRIQYQAFLPDIAIAGGGFGSTIIPIMRSAEALAYYTAAIFVAARGGSALVVDWEAKGDAATDALTNRQAKLLQRGSFRRRGVYDSARQYRRYR